MDSNALGDFLKLAVPAVAAFGAAWLANRRDREKWAARQEAEQLAMLGKQGERLALGWAEMTAQAREIIRTMQVETIEAKAALAVCMGERNGLLSELAVVKAKYEAALKELDRVASKRPTRTS